jgi:hypothetical protein
VSKPRGAKAGLVTVANEKTIRPDGDPARLARLLATSGRTPDELGSAGVSAQTPDDDEEWSEDA